MKKIVIHLLLLVVAYTAAAQKPVTAYGFFMGGITSPSSDFKNVYNNKMGGVGLAGNIGFLLNPLGLGRNKQYSPILLGIDLGWNYLGRSKFEYNGQPFLKTEFWTGNYGMLIRLDPVTGSRFRPFADGFAGWGRYWANTKEDKSFGQSLIDDNQYLVNKYHDDNFTTGLGAGFLIKAKDSNEPSFTFRVMYYFNGDYEAVQRNSITVSGNYLYYQVKNTNANMFMVQIGVSLGDL